MSASMDHTLPRSMDARASPSQLAVSVVIPCTMANSVFGAPAADHPACRAIVGEKFEIVWSMMFLRPHVAPGQRHRKGGSRSC